MDPHEVTFAHVPNEPDPTPAEIEAEERAYRLRNPTVYEICVSCADDGIETP